MKQQIAELVTQSINTLALETLPSVVIERTRDKQHGDFACNIAMQLAKPLKSNPRAIAQQVVDGLPDSTLIKDIQIAGPGFINFYVHDVAYQEVIKNALTRGVDFGTSTLGQGQRCHLEVVSANPTGPLHVGHGRLAAYGATVANVLDAAGYQTHREYYVNDAGRQMDILATSVWLRYLELFSEHVTFPCNGYKGAYVIDIAKALKVAHQEKFLHPAAEIFTADIPLDEPQGGDKEAHIDALAARTKTLLGDDQYQTVFKAGLETIQQDIHDDLAEFGVHYQEWFPESSLLTNGDIERGIKRLEQGDFLYEKEGATWFKASQFDDEKDRVVKRSNGQATYFASDVGYHFNKYERGFDHIFDIFGADHHGYGPRLYSLLKAGGENPDKLKVLLVQFAILYRGKEKVSMSTRGGEFVTLRELREEVGNDAARFFYIMRKPEQHLDFDLELAKSKSNENPVYYIQYAHARICSVLRQMKEKGFEWNQSNGEQHLASLTTEHEQSLMRSIARYPEVIETAALQYEPHLIAHFLQELATALHSYYNASKFIVEDANLRDARLCLIQATKTVISNGLAILGVSAPDEM